MNLCAPQRDQYDRHWSSEPFEIVITVGGVLGVSTSDKPTSLYPLGQRGVTPTEKSIHSLISSFSYHFVMYINE